MICLKEHLIARVAADPGCVPAASDPGGVSNVVYFRLHGSPPVLLSLQPAFSEKALLEAGEAIDPGPRLVHFDNTAAGFAIRNALQLNDNLKQPGR